MNYFAHARLFLDRPYFVAGACAPDWLMVADRRVRVRAKRAELFLNDRDPCMAEVAAGVVQHLSDDVWFHATRAFAETTLALTARARDALGGETGLRPAFLGHLLTELLLDAALIADAPADLDRYYQLLDSLDAGQIEAAVNRMTPRTTDQLGRFIELFRQARILWDYLEDGRLMERLNQVMRRVGLEPLPEGFDAILPEARKVVDERKAALLDQK